MNADFSIDVVRECRGTILDENDNFNPVCVPFFKFANYGEPYADDIDWSSARVQEKIDGSLIKVWNYKGNWRISTNKTINAQTAMTNSNEDTFLNIFNKAWDKTGKHFNQLNPDYTYMFELVSPQTRVVVPYTETKIYHIGTRDIKSLKELDIDIGIEKPKEYPISTIEECIEASQKLDRYHEGFIVVDKYWKRIKIKSPIYVAIHHVINNITSKKRVIDLIFSGEDKEIIAYFPEYKEMFDSINEQIERFIEYNENELEKINKLNFATQKELSDYVTQTICPPCLFFVANGKSKSVKDFIYGMSTQKLVAYLEKFI